MNYIQFPIEMFPHLRRLSAIQIAIWADAWTWQQNGKEARRSNAQYGEMFGVHPKSISQSIAGLRDAGCIEWSDTGGGRVLRATIPTNVTPPYKRVPSIQTSIHTNVDTPSIGTCTPPPYERGAPLHTNVDQIKKVKENRIEKRIEKKGKAKLVEVILPWDTDTFAEAWHQWRVYKKSEHKFWYKNPGMEQASLHNLQNISGGSEATAIAIIGHSIANGYKGLFPPGRGATPSPAQRLETLRGAVEILSQMK